jgi:hypothetical protein
MTRRRRINDAEANPFIVWTGLAIKASEMLMASAQVIGHRTSRMATAGMLPSLRDQHEFTLMGQEKIEAATESMQAIIDKMIGLNQQIGTLVIQQLWAGTAGMMSLAASFTPAQASKLQTDLVYNVISNSTAVASQLADSVAHVAHTGMKPIHLRATANAKRLGKLEM